VKLQEAAGHEVTSKAVRRKKFTVRVDTVLLNDRLISQVKDAPTRVVQACPCATTAKEESRSTAKAPNQRRFLAPDISI
jgi:hypothetical protein